MQSEQVNKIWPTRRSAAETLLGCTREVTEIEQREAKTGMLAAFNRRRQENRFPEFDL